MHQIISFSGCEECLAVSRLTSLIMTAGENVFVLNLATIYPDGNNHPLHFFAHDADYNEHLNKDGQPASVIALFQSPTQESNAKLIFVQPSLECRTIEPGNKGDGLTLYATKYALRSYGLDAKTIYYAKIIPKLPVIDTVYFSVESCESENWLKSDSFRNIICQMINSFPILIKKNFMFLCPYDERFEQYTAYSMDLLREINIDDCGPVQQGIFSKRTKIIVKRTNQSFNNKEKHKIVQDAYQNSQNAVLVSDFAFGLSLLKDKPTFLNATNDFVKIAGKIVDQEEWDRLTNDEDLDYTKDVLISKKAAFEWGIFDNSLVLIKFENEKWRTVRVCFADNDSESCLFISNNLAFNMVGDRALWLNKMKHSIFIKVNERSVSNS